MRLRRIPVTSPTRRPAPHRPASLRYRCGSLRVRSRPCLLAPTGPSPARLLHCETRQAKIRVCVRRYPHRAPAPPDTRLRQGVPPSPRVHGAGGEQVTHDPLRLARTPRPGPRASVSPCPTSREPQGRRLHLSERAAGRQLRGRTAPRVHLCEGSRPLATLIRELSLRGFTATLRLPVSLRGFTAGRAPSTAPRVPAARCRACCRRTV